MRKIRSEKAAIPKMAILDALIYAYIDQNGTLALEDLDMLKDYLKRNKPCFPGLGSVTNKRIARALVKLILSKRLRINFRDKAALYCVA